MTTKTCVDLLGNHPQLYGSFHTSAPIHYVTSDRKLDAAAQGVKEFSSCSLWDFIFICPLHLLFCVHVFYYFLAPKEQNQIGHKDK